MLPSVRKAIEKAINRGLGNDPIVGSAVSIAKRLADSKSAGDKAVHQKSLANEIRKASGETLTKEQEAGLDAASSVLSDCENCPDNASVAAAQALDKWNQKK